MGQEDSIFEGKTLDDAVRKGLESMGLSRAEVMIQMVEEGSNGFLGFGARPYRVRILPRPGGAIQDPVERDRDRGGRREHGGRGGRTSNNNRRGGRGGQGGGRRDEAVASQRGGGERTGARQEGRRRNGESSRRGGNRHRSDRPDRPERGERSDRPERGERSDRPERGERSDRPERGERLDRPERGERPDRPDRVERLDRPERVERLDRPERGERLDRPERGEPLERTERGDRPERAERPERVERMDAGARGTQERGPGPFADSGRGDRPDRSDRGGRRRRRRRGGRDESRERVGQEAMGAPAVPQPAPVYAGGPAAPEDDGGGRGEAAMAPMSSSHTSPSLPPEELAAEGQRLTQELLTHMGFEATVKANAEENRVDVQVEMREGEDLLTGRRGEVRQALQHLLNLMLNRGGRGLHLQLEVNDFWQRRESELEGMARDLAEQALSTGTEAVSEYLNAQERRIVHVTLREDTRVKTYALGTGLIKRVAVAPADFPSQEEAEA